MTAEEYAGQVAESNFHFPHPNFKKYIEEAFEAGYVEALKDAKGRKEQAKFIYV